MSDPLRADNYGDTREILKRSSFGEAGVVASERVGVVWSALEKLRRFAADVPTYDPVKEAELSTGGAADVAGAEAYLIEQSKEATVLRERINTLSTDAQPSEVETLVDPAVMHVQNILAGIERTQNGQQDGRI